MARNLLKYNTTTEFTEEQGEGNDVTSIAPGVAYVVENGSSHYNAPEDESQEGDD